MALNIYSDKELITEKLIFINDGWFNSEFASRPNLTLDETITSLMESIDEAHYVGNYRMDTPFGNGVDITHLSTGCKTAINIYLFPKYVFYTGECGNNALLEIMKLRHGSVFMDSRPYVLNNTTDFEIDVNIISNTGTEHCTGIQEFIRKWDGDNYRE